MRQLEENYHSAMHLSTSMPMHSAAADGAHTQWGGGQHANAEIQLETDNKTYTSFSLTDQWLSNLHNMHCTPYLLHMQYPSARHQRCDRCDSSGCTTQ